jgi:hypothetical protein
MSCHVFSQEESLSKLTSENSFSVSGLLSLTTVVFFLDGIQRGISDFHVEIGC